MIFDHVNVQAILQILSIELAIPLWQMGLFVFLISLFMILHRLKLCLITTYLFTLYWGFLFNWGDVVASLGTFPQTATLYLIFGSVHVVLTLTSFLQENS